MGGDHSLSMGSVNGVARYWQEKGRPLFVLWLDAHADYNTPQTTETGNMHGMSAAFLCGEPGLDGLLGDQPRASIGPDQLDLFGIRSIDPLEKKLVFERRVAIADMRAIDEFGVGVLIRKVIERVRAQNGVLHVSFDVDFLDPAVAPGVGTTVPGGATYREAHLIMELLHDSGLVRSVDIVELNPFLDERGRTARVAVELIGSLFGLQITDRRTPSNAVLPDSTSRLTAESPRQKGGSSSRRFSNRVRSLSDALLRRELQVRRGGADFGVDLGFELGKVLLEHADQRARGLVELGLVRPGVDADRGSRSARPAARSAPRSRNTCRCGIRRCASCRRARR